MLLMASSQSLESTIENNVSRYLKISFLVFNPAKIMNRMKKLILYIPLLCYALSSTAEDVDRVLYVTMKDGTQTEFRLNTEPAVSTETQSMTLHIQWTDEEGIPFDAIFDLLQVKDFTFGEHSTAMEVLKEEKVTIQGDFLMVPTDNAPILVATIDGRKVEMTTVQNGNSTLLDMRKLPKGIYVINCNGNSLKLLRP